jgi:preprotein translocase subunit SecY
MASAAEQLVSNMNFGVLAKASELKQRIFFALGALIVFRLGIFIPLPGLDPAVIADIFSTKVAGGVLGMFNMFTGGALERFSIFTLGIMPYISASIIIQLMTLVSKDLANLKKEGEMGRKRLNQYMRWLTLLLAALQALGVAYGLESMQGANGNSAVLSTGLFFRITTVVTLTGGSMFVLWLAEQITARGVGNGSSLIIFAGIVAGLPGAIGTILDMGHTQALSVFAILLVGLMVVGVIAFIVFMERAQRRLVVQYPKRQQGNKMYGGESSHLPIKLNSANVIPAIFASSLLLLPATWQGFMSSTDSPEWLQTLATWLQSGHPVFMGLYASLIIFFTFFYTAIVFNPEETADNLKKYGGFIPGIRPGKNTADYIDHVLTRLTLVGALYLAAVCLLPELMRSQIPGMPFYLGGTGLLIVVSVTIDTVGQIHSHLLAHQYEGLIKKAKLRGRRG